MLIQICNYVPTWQSPFVETASLIDITIKYFLSYILKMYPPFDGKKVERDTLSIEIPIATLRVSGNDVFIISLRRNSRS